MTNHFELFGLAPSFALDAGALERAFRELQSRVHPDRFAQAGDAERRASMQWSTRANEAYRMLKDPVQRARYLLELHGVDTGFETDTRMPADFLARQIELREALEEAKEKQDPTALDAVKRDLAVSSRALEAELASCIDGAQDYAGAASAVRRLQFLRRLSEEVEAAYDFE
ncbi:MAG: Fe-S protein assembly co-chaperone HscB [Proteobacteria bacterium]|nr:Fe-S protein assembly co-chaperone HscB [Pseudomonadota bacterium]MDA0982040.1 Fe-S protein assembly co-chaperone HscB [Pseudomonadota bacterium]